MKWKIIAAMNEDRVIGLKDRLPWRIPEDIAWYQSQTDGQLILMGRKTFESIRRRPEGSAYIVLSNTLQPEDVQGQNVTIIRNLSELASLNLTGEGWVCGGGKLYSQMLHACDEIYLTQVKGKHEGDTHFPPFEQDFESPRELLHHDAFTVNHYTRKGQGGNKTAKTHRPHQGHERGQKP